MKAENAMNASAQSSNPLHDAILAARVSHVPAKASKALEPASRPVAYATQHAVAMSLGVHVAGWKVGMLPDGTPMAAPMFASDVRANGASWPLPPGGALVAEVEVALRLGHDLPPRPGKPYTRDEIAAAVSEVLVGIELLKSRFAGDGFPAFPIHLADNLGNVGYVIGEATRDFASLDLARLRCRYALDGVEAQDRIGGHPQDDPWAPVIACVNEAAVGLDGFCAGQVITTGSLIKPRTIDGPVLLSASLDGIGSVSVTFMR
jgi:2-keto-4-pentenoate hydratase